MDDTVKIPTLVRSQLSLYAAEARMKAEQMDAALRGRQITTMESRRMRGQRERFVAEAAAWEWLHEIAAGDRVPAPVIEPDPCQDCKHRPHSGGGDYLSNEPDPCQHCKHPHIEGVACRRHVSPDGTECGCEK